jgi:hypothetical protein
VTSGLATFAIPFGAATRARLPGVRGRVDVTATHVRVRFGVLFVASVSRRSIRAAQLVRTARWMPIGASEHLGGWVVHGRPGPAVELRLRPAASARANGSSTRTSTITVGVADPAALLEALGFGPDLDPSASAEATTAGSGPDPRRGGP